MDWWNVSIDPGGREVVDQLINSWDVGSVLLDGKPDVSLSGRYTKTCSGEDFLLVDNGDDHKIMIFATEENLRSMSEVDAFYIDGTFSTCSSVFLSSISFGILMKNLTAFFLFFLQVFMIHILLYGRTFPMAYCLLPNKEGQTYNSLHVTQRCCSSIGCHF